MRRPCRTMTLAPRPRRFNFERHLKTRCYTKRGRPSNSLSYRIRLAPRMPCGPGARSRCSLSQSTPRQALLKIRSADVGNMSTSTRCNGAASSNMSIYAIVPSDGECGVNVSHFGANSAIKIDQTELAPYGTVCARRNPIALVRLCRGAALVRRNRMPILRMIKRDPACQAKSRRSCCRSAVAGRVVR
ncbi:hypothetical protein KY49_6919 [Burkholderia sp. MSHR3999]|nr:hypothetical protein KY49_6919 [Burkholderia sp. MSHR3999]